MTTTRRFWVEVTPRFAASPPRGPVPTWVAEVRPSLTSVPVTTGPVPGAGVTEATPAEGGAVPARRLTELAVAAGLEGVELDAELVSVQRQLSALAAYRAGLVERKATLGARHALPYAPVTRTSTRTDADVDADRDAGSAGAGQAADEFLPEEVAVLLGMSVPSTRHLVDHLLTLVRELPVVWHALADGRIDETRARVLVTVLGHQAASVGGPVPDQVVDAVAARGVGWAAAGCPPTTLRERLHSALVAADPDTADQRARERQRTADVTATSTGDGLVELRVTQCPAEEGRQVTAQLSAYARAMRAEGTPARSGCCGRPCTPR